MSETTLKVGTTGDYKPFSYWNPSTKSYEGLDIDMAHMIGYDLKLTVEFVKTTWKTLSSDIIDKKFDIAMSGITRTPQRVELLGMSIGYVKIGKSPLIRKDDYEKFKTIEEINQPDVTIGVNIGGTNEAFVDSNMYRAKVIKFKDNLKVPKAVIRGKVDVMITDNVEAMIMQNEHSELYAQSLDSLFTKDEIGILFNPDNNDWDATLNNWLLRQMHFGKIDELKKKWGIFNEG
ncbi:MAG: cyclohexadienyl dehydratase [Thalassobius sp.]|nr:cyclohexadienyl dehydratase [Thalassovita sp.]